MDLNVTNLIIFYGKNKEKQCRTFSYTGIFTRKSTSFSFVSVMLFKEDKIIFWKLSPICLLNQTIFQNC